MGVTVNMLGVDLPISFLLYQQVMMYRTPGKKPASMIPKKKRMTRICRYVFTSDMTVTTAPHTYSLSVDAGSKE